MTAKQLAGAAILMALFGGLFAFAVATVGWLGSLAAFGGTFALLALLSLASWLLEGDA